MQEIDILPQKPAQQPFSYESFISDDYLCGQDSSFYRNLCFENDSCSEENFIPQLKSGQQATQHSLSSLNCEELSNQMNISTQDQKNSFQLSENKQDKKESIYHYANYRRKMHETQPIKKICRIVAKYASNAMKSKFAQPDMMKSAKITKNFLAFGKKSHMDFIIKQKGRSFVDQRQWLKEIQEKDGINLQDYDSLYKCKQLKECLKLMFRKKILYRDLMASRTTPQNKIFYLYVMQVWERNFKKGQFKSMSEVMIEIEKEKQYL